MTDETSIQKAANLIAGSSQLAVLTGAGVSKESGVPTFRDAHEGLWEQYDPAQLATPQAFQNDPKLVWDWYTYRRGLVRKAQPNPGHIALAQLEQYVPSLVVITQNVDDLHEQAGSSHVIHLHGNIARNKCFNDCRGNPTLIDLEDVAADEDAPPVCPYCGAYLRPDVVWFGEMLPMHALNDAKQYSIDCDVMLVIGTSGLVTPAASLPGVAQNTGATLIEVNPDYSMITRIADIKLDGPSGEIMPRILSAMES